jgi:hypothetical protein
MYYSSTSRQQKVFVDGQLFYMDLLFTSSVIQVCITAGNPSSLCLVVGDQLAAGPWGQEKD